MCRSKTDSVTVNPIIFNRSTGKSGTQWLIWVVSSKTLYQLLSTGSTLEDRESSSEQCT